MFPIEFIDLNKIYGLFVTLTFKIGIMSCFAAVVVLSHRFRRLLLQEKKNELQWLAFNLSFGALLLLGVFSRLIYGYRPADLSLEGVFLLGLIEGIPAGVLVGSLIGLFNLWLGEYLTLPFLVLAGIAGGVIHLARPEKIHLYRLMPFPPTLIYRAFRGYLRERTVMFEVYPLVAIFLLDSLRMIVAVFTGKLFALTSANPLAVLLIFLFDAGCVGVPLWLWHHEETEERLSESNAQLTQARLDALRTQINPHFLFNSLNTISALARTDPERSRFLIGKLSGLLRRLMDDTSEMVPLRKELDFIDDYLSIEQARYGSRLQIHKEIHPETEDVFIPTMVLQPIVENAVNHGIAPHPRGGRVEIFTEPKNEGVLIRVKDNGVGVHTNPAAKGGNVIPSRSGEGLGLKNVEERLRVIYGKGFRLNMGGRVEGGTEVEVFLPERRLVYGNDLEGSGE